MVTHKVTQWWYCVVFEVFCDLNYDISPVVKDCYVSIILFLIGWCLWFVLNLKFKRVLIHGHGSSVNHLNLYKKKWFWIYIRTVWKKLQCCWDILITSSTYKPVRLIAGSIFCSMVCLITLCGALNNLLNLCRTRKVFPQFGFHFHILNSFHD